MTSAYFGELINAEVSGDRNGVKEHFAQSCTPSPPTHVFVFMKTLFEAHVRGFLVVTYEECTRRFPIVYLAQLTSRVRRLGDMLGVCTGRCLVARGISGICSL